ncbi:E3 ubiquitin/ISG15 ligase TRIM25-like [Aquarana catesbeiana]|uniref:E3 ubiquitin/ISG15 ligase TRIM25-like n=1 Tax=Aquarana catesbeiana TaxID=8400 RepID=UPI003CCA19C8
MASGDLRAELECSVCLNIYTDPVTLKCGHKFCRVCIDRVLDTQEGSGGYSCPECREKFLDRLALQKNMKLRNIAETFLSAQPDQDESRVFCTHCVDSPVPAVRSCLHCEVSLCDKHLRVHKKSPEHILCDPTLSMESRKCSIHKKILEYYCTEDETCVCKFCVIGEHTGHKMKSLDEASEKKKETLRNVLQKLLTKREETEERVQSLQEHRRKVEEEAAGDTERVTALFTDLRRRLEDLEKRVLRDISGRAERISISIRDLEIKKEELSRKMRHIEELCNMTDPLTVLQESDTGDLCDTEDGDNEDRERHEELLHDGGGLDVAGVLHKGLSDIITEVNVYFYIQGAADILLDGNTAHNYLQISEDRKTVSGSYIEQNHPKTPERFQLYPQVMSSQSFSSGRHYWEVDVGGSDGWIVGMCYPSIERTVGESLIGRNKKSWGLGRYYNQYRVRHDSNEILLPTNLFSNRVRIYLDYEVGRISFYDLCDPIRHLHTFTTTFTEPLHAGLGVYKGCIKICGGRWEM